MSACASLPPQADRVATQALARQADTRLGNTYAAAERQHADSTAMHLLPDGVDALLARIALAEAADHSLDLQYYIWHDDLTGRHLAHALLRAADRGVRVRLLLDDLGTNADDQVLLALASHPNISVRLFNPVANRRFKRISALVDFGRIDRRMHNKALIADNQAAILGGRNIGDEYFGASSEVAFGDLDILMHGVVVPQVSTAFDAFWNADSAYPIERLMGRAAAADALAGYRAKLDAFVAAERASPYVTQVGQRLAQFLDEGGVDFAWGKATVLYDDPAKISRAPEDTQGHLLPQLQALHVAPTRQMLVVSPYFIPGDAGVAWLRGLSERGVQVTVLTNSLAATDVSAVHAGYQRYRKDLLAAGIHLYELKPAASDDGKAHKKSLLGSSKASLHAKTYVFDRGSIFVGSMNLDPRSVMLNTEIGVYCESPMLAGEVVDSLLPQLDRIAWRLALRNDEQGREHIVWIDSEPGGAITERDEPEVSALRRIGIWFLSILPIESEL
ncbi:phospholipase D family protein [Andreprevotia sp. IGB-42]|uniref:phospholipase D family protein n=1 Tax=Andreprevotia sp. IGB-42 TaxID=2497473 RepID=UPI00191CEDD2|nr:phospholipase D family protein [Andreprevotia sp. IGB-42]